MQITIIQSHGGAGRGPESRMDLRVVADGDATLGDVLSRSGVDLVDTALIDGRAVGVDQAFADVCHAGAVVDVTGSGRALASAPPAVGPAGSSVVRVVGGLCAGATHPLGHRAEVVVGRSVQADVVIDDPTVSPCHVRLRREGRQWYAQDLGSHNGTAVAGGPVGVGRPVTGRPLRLGATSITVEPLGPDIAHVQRVDTDGATLFNRPPRPTPAVAEERIEVPDPPAERRRGAAFSLAALVGPVVIGLVMVQMLGSMRYALFALLAPVMMITNAVATRRRNTKDAKSSARRFRRELAAFHQTLSAAAAAEAARRDRAMEDLATLLRRVEVGSVRLWERRGHHPDHLTLRLGIGPAAWDPPVDAKRVGAHDELREAVDRHRRIDAAVMGLSLGDGEVVGIVGGRRSALAVARSLVIQAAVLHGPADVSLAVAVADHDRAQDWDWAKWLPHTRAGEASLLAVGIEPAAALVDSLSEALSGDPTRGLRPEPVIRRAPLLLVIDGDELTTARRAPARELLRGDHGPVAAIVVATSAERLPSSCTVVVELEDDLGAATVHHVQRDEAVAGVVVDGLSCVPAERAARLMARFADPDRRAAAGALPSRCGLLDAAELQRDRQGAVPPAEICRRWGSVPGDAADCPRSEDEPMGRPEKTATIPGEERAGKARQGTEGNRSARSPDTLDVSIGAGADGPVIVDLVADGPHALVGGTTGAGKSELLRSLVAGLAVRYPPEDLVFVLIDYKGGSAFDACARLPHTVGLVTDLDGHLAERALRSLEAELHHRERVLREAGAGDLGEYRRTITTEPLPRLVLVVDEFATLAAELPHFMTSLVGIAQRGRSLGVHMILATQRPAGAVSADIKANTNIRIALRMQDDRDSIDVIDAPDAADIDRRTPGRAFVRLGPGELVAVQTPLSAATSATPGVRVSVAPFRFGDGVVVEPVIEAGVDSDLEVLVDAAVAAHGRLGGRPPRRPWLEMPASVAFDDIVGESPQGAVPVALADDPDRQRHSAAVWDPADGHLALLGAVGSGCSDALHTTALAVLATATGPVHLYGVDYGGALAGLDGHAACGAVIAGQDHERQRRLVHLLRAEITRRRSDPVAGTAAPRLILLVDDLPAWLADHGDAAGQELTEDIRRLFAEGPSAGLVVAFTAARSGAVPMRLWGAVTGRFFFRHADPDEVTVTGLRRHELPAFTTSRAIDGGTRLVVQFPDRSTAAVDRPVPASWPAPWPIEALPDLVPVQVLDEAQLGLDEACWMIPVGIDASRHATAHLPLRAGDGVLVAGPAGSGVSTTLETLARQVRRHAPVAVLVAVAGGRSPLALADGLFDAVGTLGELGKVLEVAALDRERRWLVVVDDAHLLDEPGALEPLLRPGSRCRLVVGGRSDHLHGSFGHWTRAVRRSSTGLLLNPRLDADGDLLGVRLPRHPPVPLRAGRGFLVADADTSIVHLAA